MNLVNLMFSTISKNKGFSFIEMIIAIFILIVGIIGVSSAVFKIVFYAPFIPSRLIAVYLAQEGIEIIRNIRDTNWLEEEDWDTGLTFCSVGCEADYKSGTAEEETPLRSYTGSYLNVDDNNFYSYSAGVSTKYKRQIYITKLEDDKAQVTVYINWEEKGKSFLFEAEEYLYNWY